MCTFFSLYPQNIIPYTKKPSISPETMKIFCKPYWAYTNLHSSNKHSTNMQGWTHLSIQQALACVWLDVFLVYSHHLRGQSPQPAMTYRCQVSTFHGQKLKHNILLVGKVMVHMPLEIANNSNAWHSSTTLCKWVNLWCVCYVRLANMTQLQATVSGKECKYTKDEPM